MAKQKTMKADKQEPMIVRVPETKVELSLPLSKVDPAAYVQRHYDLHITEREGLLLKCLFKGLNDGARKIGDTDRYVQRPTDALRWLVNHVASRV